MLYETLNQPLICLILLVSGFASGFVFDISNYIVFLCKNNKIIQFVFDFFSTIIVSSVLFVLILTFDFGNIRLYHFIIFFIFLILQRITLGKLIAKLIQICYNFFIKIFNGLKRIKFCKKKKETINY